MNKKDLNKFKKLLLTERDRILKGVQNMERDVLYQAVDSSKDTDVTSLAEVGTDAFERETAPTLAGAESERLYEIDQALERIEKGTYGICEGTGEPIARKRLEAFPAARYCIEYQEELEKERRF